MAKQTTKKTNRKMTKTEFFKQLSKTKGWLLQGDCIRNKNDCCPVAYLANLKLKKKAYTVQVGDPAEVLNIDHDLAWTIADAADNFLDDSAVSIRKQLLKACKLT